MSRFPAMLLFVLVLASCATVENPPSRAKRFINDRQLRTRMTQRTMELMKAKKARSAKDVMTELQKAPKRCSLFLMPPSHAMLGTRRVYGERLDSVCVISMLYKCKNRKCGKWHVNNASGFFVNHQGVFVTNYHVLNRGEPDQFPFVVTAEGNAYPIKRILAANMAADLAIAEVDAPVDKVFHYAPLSKDAPVGADVVVISHPQGRHFTCTRGIISRYFMRGTGKSLRRMTITADYAGGSSGGPLFDVYGNVIGVVSSTSEAGKEDKKGTLHQQMVFKDSIPADSLLDMVE